jgi:twitching motility two-component system response regulator PilH
MGEQEAPPRDGIQVFIPPARDGLPLTKPSGLQVLMAEDDRDVRTLLRLVLRLDGHQVIEAPTPAEAVALAVKSRPGLILLDVNFSGSDGISAVREVREIDETKDVPIILFSGKSKTQDQIVGLEQGADAYVVKPVDPLYLLETIWEITGMSPIQREDRRNRELARLRSSA